VVARLPPRQDAEPDAAASKPMSRTSEDPLLEVRDLSVDLASPQGAAIPIVDRASFRIDPGNIVGLFGDSGCGKTTLALALLQLLPARYTTRGSVLFQGRELVGLPERRLESVRGAGISIVFQDPLLALNPVMRIRDQVREVQRAHPGREQHLDTLFSLVGLPSTRRIFQAYPHQLSGGERQRVAIAQALAARPALLIADEPFTALDPVRIGELISLFQQLRDRLETSFLVISHHPGILARLAGDVLVMRAGCIVERGAPRELFAPMRQAWGLSPF